MHKPESCSLCGQWTRKGRQQLRDQSKPIYGTDLSKPISELIENVRRQLAQARGELSDIGHRYSGWEERCADVQGLLTCGLISLHRLMEEAKACEKAASIPLQEQQP